MRNLIKRSLVIAALTASMAGQSIAGHEQLPKDRAGGDMFLDAVFARPMGLVAIMAGSVGWVIALPFTIFSGSVGSSADEMVLRPVQYTFTRPLGQLEEPE